MFNDYNYYFTLYFRLEFEIYIYIKYKNVIKLQVKTIKWIEIKESFPRGIKEKISTFVS